MPPVANEDELALRISTFAVSCDLDRFDIMPSEMYQKFIKFHKTLRHRSASGALDWRDVGHATFFWENEEFLPKEYLSGLRISNFSKIGVVYSMDFINGYMFNGGVSKLPLDIMSLSNASAFAFGVDGDVADFEALLELKWPSTFTATI